MQEALISEDDGKEVTVSLRQTAYEILYPEGGAGRKSPPRWIAVTGGIAEGVILLLILVNVAYVIFEADSADDGTNGLEQGSGGGQTPGAQRYFPLEAFSTFFFSVEYLLRFWCSAEDAQFAGWRGRLKWVVGPMALIDLVCLGAFYVDIVSFFLNSGEHRPDRRTHATISLRMVRMLRIVALLKLERQAHAFVVLKSVLVSKLVHLLVCLYAALVMIALAGSLMFSLETAEVSVARKHPDSVTADSTQRIVTLWDAMYWAAMSITTVGYGPNPASWGGQALCVLLSVIGGPLFVAVPAGIIGAGFAETLEEHRKRRSQSKKARRTWAGGSKAVPVDGTFSRTESTSDTSAGDIRLGTFTALGASADQPADKLTAARPIGLAKLGPHTALDAHGSGGQSWRFRSQSEGEREGDTGEGGLEALELRQLELEEGMVRLQSLQLMQLKLALAQHQTSCLVVPNSCPVCSAGGGQAVAATQGLRWTEEEQTVIRQLCGSQDSGHVQSQRPAAGRPPPVAPYSVEAVGSIKNI